MGLLHYEAVDYNDPLSLMLLAEEDEDSEVEHLHSQYDAGLARRSTFEVEKTVGDMLGSSPFELDNPDWH